MANFTVRVELHKAEWADYDRLHAAMEQKGFSRQITSDDGKAYHMPWAEYGKAKRRIRHRSGEPCLGRTGNGGILKFPGER